MNSRVKIAVAVVGVLIVGGAVFFATRPAPNKTVAPPQTVVYSGGNPSQQQILQEEKKLFPVVSSSSTARGQAQARLAKQALVASKTKTPSSGSGNTTGGTVGLSNTKLPPKFDILSNVNVSAVPSWATQGALIAGSYDLGWSMCIEATTQDASKQVLQADWSGQFAAACSSYLPNGYPKSQVYTDTATVTLDSSSTAFTLPYTWYWVTITMTGVGPNGTTINLTRTDHVGTAYTVLGPIVGGMVFGKATSQ